MYISLYALDYVSHSANRVFTFLFIHLIVSFSPLQASLRICGRIGNERSSVRRCDREYDGEGEVAKCVQEERKRGRRDVAPHSQQPASMLADVGEKGSEGDARLYRKASPDVEEGKILHKYRPLAGSFAIVERRRLESGCYTPATLSAFVVLFS